MINETYLLLMILGTGISAVFAAIYYKKGLNPVKKAQKKAEMSLFDNLTDYREVEKATIADILKQKDNQIKSLNARLTQLEPQEEEDPGQKSATFEEITQLVKQTYPQYTMLLPMFKSQIMKGVKGMSINEIVSTIQSFAKSGGKSPLGIGQTDPSGNNPNWA